MGYSRSISTLRFMEPHLRLLAEGTPCEWARSREDAEVWAYKIREALSIAKAEFLKRPEDMTLKALSDAQQLFSIKVISKTLVRAVFANPTELGEEPIPSRQALTPSPAHRVSQIRTVEDLQGVWRAAQPSNDKLHFPDAQLSDMDLMLAAAWAAALTPPWMILRPRGTNSLTLAPDDPRVPAEAKVKGPRRAVSADDPPAQVSDQTPSGRSWEKPRMPPPPAVEPPDADGHGEAKE